MSINDAFDSMIQVHVGTEPGKTFSIYEVAVTKTSKFFKAALEKDWLEARERKVKLPEADVRSVKIFLRWTMTRSVKKHPSNTDGKSCEAVATEELDTEFNVTSAWSPKLEPRSSPPGQICCHENMDQLIRAYVFGDSIQAIGFKNAVIDEILEVCELHINTPDITSTNYLYDNTPKRDQLRRCIIDRVAWSGLNNFFKRDEEYHEEFMKSIATHLLWRHGVCEFRTKDAPYYQEMCLEYHQHGDGFDDMSCKETKSLDEWHSFVAWQF